jgi:hypothetical protein
MAAAVAFRELVLKNEAVRRLRWTPVVLCLAFVVVLGQKSWTISQAHSGYEKVARIIKSKDPQGKILTTQPLVMSLFMAPEDIKPAPKTVRELIILYARGYRYLVMDPQAYVSWTADGARFTPVLTDYLGVIRDHLPPIFAADHLDRVMLERFVLDHNENLGNSVRFLQSADKNFGAIYVYDIAACLEIMQKMMQSKI